MLICTHVPGLSRRGTDLSELESKRYDKAVIGQVSPGWFFSLVRCLLIQLRVLFSLPTHLLSWGFLKYFLSAFVILRSCHGYHKLARRSLNCAKERTEKKKKGSSQFARRQGWDWPSISSISACWLRIQLMWQSIFTKWISDSPTSVTPIASLITAFCTEKKTKQRPLWKKETR